MKKWGMTLRLFAVLLLTGLLITIPFLWNYALRTERYLADQNQRERQFLLSSANQAIEAYADHIKSAMILMSSHVVFQPGGSAHSIQEALADLSTNNAASIHTLYFIPTDGKVLCSRQAIFDALGNPSLKEILAQISTKPSLQWIQPYYSNMSGYVLACAIPIRDHLRSITGYLVAECSYGTFLRRLTTQLVSEDLSYCLLNADGTSIYTETSPAWIPRAEHAYPPAAHPGLIAHIAAQTGEHSEYPLAQGALQIHQTRDNQLNWTLALISRRSPWLGMSRGLILQTGAAIVLGLCLLSLSMAWILMRPLRRLVLHMRSIRSIHDLRPVGSARKDEIGQLIQSYDFMMENIQQLMQSIRMEETLRSDLELKMLRSQIGPHFLYNTLSCIASLSRQGQAETVSNAISALIDLLSFSFDRSEEMVGLADELHSLNSYITIQHMRYGEALFAYRADWDRALAQIQVPKLILQPIVENAIFHGLLPIEREGRFIHVHCARVDATLRIQVEDNGAGIPPAMLERLLQGLEAPLHDRFSNIGISNVAKRLKLHYGESAGLSIHSAERAGTRVSIHIPC